MNKAFLIGTLVVFGVFLLGLVLYGILSYPTDSAPIEKSNSQAPDFSLQDVEGNQITLSSYQGQKPVMLVFWATWCSFCAQELEDLKEFTERHKEDVQVIAVPSGEVKRTVEEYIAEKDINFLMLLDETKQVWNEYGVRGTPSHFLINKEGKIFVKKPGLSTLEDLEKMLLMII